jgi:hypothetical protein
MWTSCYTKRIEPSATGGFVTRGREAVDSQATPASRLGFFWLDAVLKWRGNANEKRSAMRRFLTNILSCAFILAFAPAAHAQSANDLVGPWKLVSNILDQDGKKSDQFGPSPNGVLFFESNGHYALVIAKAGLPKFPGSGRSSGTDEINRAVVEGSIGHFGTYKVEDGAIVFHVDHSTFPNWDGGTQKRPFKIEGEQLSFFVSSASAGGGSSVVTWTRLK